MKDFLRWSSECNWDSKPTVSLMRQKVELHKQGEVIGREELKENSLNCSRFDLLFLCRLKPPS